ncbi:MAG TPA: hypothetical protein PKA90_05160 [Ignavibacteria bacterium]|nr:hypothetical protein [Ignavibacteria bacterium]HMR39799.1 hypothetical protein [Ignavibacteria bacterium]
MFKSNLIGVLKTFSKQELKEFYLFIQSPVYNTNQSIIKLYDQLKLIYPEFDEMQSSKKLLFKKAFGNIEYDDSFMRMNVFRLTELVKEFLIYIHLRKNNVFKTTILLEELNYRELDTLLKKTLTEQDKKIEKEKAKDSDTYFAKYKLEYYKNDIKSRDTKMITYKDKLDKDLILEQKYMNINFFINSLKFFQYFLNQKNFVVNTNGYPDFTGEILKFLGQNPEYLNEPELKLYYDLVQLLLTKDEKYFNVLKKKLFENSDDLKINSKHNLVSVIRNYAQLKIHEGKSEFKDTSFEILKFSLDKDIITYTPQGNYMTETRFMAVVWSGLIVKKYDFTEKFIKKYIEKIEPDKRQYVFAYNYAKLEFERGNFSDALKRLEESGKITNVMYKAATKQLYLMIYFEMNMYVQAFDLLDSYRHFVKTDKLLPEMYRSQCNTFINFFNRLLKIAESNGNDSFELKKLIKELGSTSQLWLLKKAKEITLTPG